MGGSICPLAACGGCVCWVERESDAATEEPEEDDSTPNVAGSNVILACVLQEDVCLAHFGPDGFRQAAAGL